MNSNSSSINCCETAYMLLTSTRSWNYKSEICTNGVKISQTASIKYLCVVLDKNFCENHKSVAYVGKVFTPVCCVQTWTFCWCENIAIYILYFSLFHLHLQYCIMGERKVVWKCIFLWIWGCFGRCKKRSLKIHFPMNLRVLWEVKAKCSESTFSGEVWVYWGVYGKGSESAFSHEFTPSLYLKDENQKISQKRLFISTLSIKKVLMCFSTKVGRHFVNSNNLGSYFCPDFRGSSQVFKDFSRIFRNFAQILNKSKLFGVHFHPRLLHHRTCKAIVLHLDEIIAALLVG